MTEEQVFLAALDVPAAADRAAYLDRVCGGDGGLRTRVESLLAAHFETGAFLDEPLATPFGPVAAAPHPEPACATAGHAAGAADDLPFLQPPTRPDAIGRLGHYEVLQVVGRGGFGIVLRAFDTVLQRVVALKVLAPAIAATSPARKRFLREARASAAVRHENVVQIYAVEEQPLPYLVMEFIPGDTLQQRLDRTGPLDAAEVARLGRQIADGLAAAHATGLIHRDIKPGNVLVEGANNRVKITDFGLARAADDASRTQSGALAGTPMFMAPEQARGEPLDHRADLFSLGSVLYTLAAGRPPFRAGTTYAVLKRVAEDDPRPIRDVIPETPTWLCEVIARLHAKAPADRFQTALEVAAALAAGGTRDTSPAPGLTPPRSPRRRARAWAAAAVLLAVVAVGATELIGWTHLVRGESSPAEAPAPEPAPIPAATPAPAPGPVVNPGPVPQPTQETTPLVPPAPLAFKNSIGMEFVLVPKGQAPQGGRRDKPANRELIVPQDFYLGRYEVTQEEWAKVMGRNPSYHRRGNDKVRDVPDGELNRFPVESVTWDDCRQFVDRLNAREKDTGWVYRLPRLWEWEYACRGGPAEAPRGGSFDFYFARPTNDPASGQANWKDAGLARPCEVGRYEPNRLGLYDMHGNVQELCEGFIGTGDKLTPSAAKRGGSWAMPSAHAAAAAAATSASLKTARQPDTGFRLARFAVGAPEAGSRALP